MRFLIFLLFSSLSSSLFAATALPLSDAEIDTLAAKKEWQDLLHYHGVGAIKGTGSQIDDPNFFLAKEGSQDPAAELKASLAGFLQGPTLSDTNQAAQCRYPARFFWLKKQRPDLPLQQIECPDFDPWFAQINGESVYLIFPAAYLNSPSSMYGHTLFRVKKKGNDAPLLDYAVNYAANADPDDNQLVFSYKGLTGGYPGVVSVMPYYQKVKEYNFLESRDIWEYKLDLTPFEVQQFVRHVWEMQNTQMSYYFFSENCSYQLLTLLDASSPRLNLADEFSLWAIPADTVRVLKKANMIDDASYRPSLLNRMSNMLNQLDDEHIDVAKALVDNEQLDLTELDTYSDQDQAQILEIAYEYSRYLVARKKVTSSYLNGRSIKLLSLRSKRQRGEVFTPVKPPALRDDQGHQTQRLGLSLGSRDSKAYSVLEYRPSYHGLLDPQGGYLKGAELSMFSGSLRWDEAESVEIDTFSFINIRSLAPKNALVTPKSWQVNASLLRDHTIDDELVFRLKGGAGVTQEVGQSMFSVLLNGSGSVEDDYQDGYRLEAGPEFKWLWYGEQNNLQLGFEYLTDINLHNAERRTLNGVWAHQLAPDWQMRLSTSHSWYEAKSWNDTSIQLLHYF
jgi:hypothetical protein